MWFGKQTTGIHKESNNINHSSTRSHNTCSRVKLIWVLASVTCIVTTIPLINASALTCNGVEDAEWCPTALEYCDWPQVSDGCPVTCGVCITSTTSSTRTNIETSTTVTTILETSTTVTTIIPSTKTTTSITTTPFVATTQPDPSESVATPMTKVKETISPPFNPTSVSSTATTVTTVTQGVIMTQVSPILCGVSPDAMFCQNVKVFCNDSVEVRNTCPRTCNSCLHDDQSTIATTTTTEAPSSVRAGPLFQPTLCSNNKGEPSWCKSISSYCRTDENFDESLAANCPMSCGKCNPTPGPSVSLTTPAPSPTPTQAPQHTLSTDHPESQTALMQRKCNGVEDAVWCESAKDHCLTSVRVSDACKTTCNTCVITTETSTVPTTPEMVECNGVADPDWCMTIKMFCTIDYGLTASCPATCSRCPRPKPVATVTADPRVTNPLHFFMLTTSPTPPQTSNNVVTSDTSSSKSENSHLPTVLIGSMIVLLVIFFGVVLYHCLHQKPPTSKQLQDNAMGWDNDMMRSPTYRTPLAFVRSPTHDSPILLSSGHMISAGADGTPIIRSPTYATEPSSPYVRRPLPQVPGENAMEGRHHTDHSLMQNSPTTDAEKAKFSQLLLDNVKTSQLVYNSVTSTDGRDKDGGLRKPVFFEGPRPDIPESKMAVLRQTLTEDHHPNEDQMLYERAASCYTLAMPKGGEGSRLGNGKKESLGIYETISHVKTVPPEDTMYDTAAATLVTKFAYRDSGTSDNTCTPSTKRGSDDVVEADADNATQFNPSPEVATQHDGDDGIYDNTDQKPQHGDDDGTNTQPWTVQQKANPEDRIGEYLDDVGDKDC